MKANKGVYQRKDGSWEARYKKGTKPNGRADYGAVYAQTEEEVIKKRNEKMAELSATATDLNLLILGASTHGKDVKEIAESLRIFKKIKFLDDNLIGRDIIGKCDDAKELRKQFPCAFIAIGDNFKRKKLAEQLKEYLYIMPNIIAPSAVVSPQAHLGEGTVILPQATVGAATIGDFAIIASNCTINSGTVLEDYTHADCGSIVGRDATVIEGYHIHVGEIYQ